MFSFSKVERHRWVNHVACSVRMAGEVEGELSAQEELHPAPIRSAAQPSDNASRRSRVGIPVCSSQPLVL